MRMLTLIKGLTFMILWVGGILICVAKRNQDGKRSILFWGALVSFTFGLFTAPSNPMLYALTKPLYTTPQISWVSYLPILLNDNKINVLINTSSNGLLVFLLSLTFVWSVCHLIKNLADYIKNGPKATFRRNVNNATDVPTSYVYTSPLTSVKINS